MIKNPTLGSARAETSERRARRIVAGAFALATILLPFGAWGTDSSPKLTADTTGNLLPLPPIPYLDSMRWMRLEAERSDIQGRHTAVARWRSTRLFPNSNRV